MQLTNSTDGSKAGVSVSMNGDVASSAADERPLPTEEIK
jgi:hypothetical protein